MMQRTTPHTTVGDDQLWHAVLNRDAAATFVYAVRSTGVYCRPACPSRRPRRHHVTFYAAPHTAEQAGFRPCRRCRPQDRVSDPQRDLVERACRLIEAESDARPSLTALGAQLGVSSYHLQRTFKRILGITPRQYADAHRLHAFKSSVKSGRSITDALYDAGYGSGSRLYEQSTAHLGMQPSVYQKGGLGMEISYSTAACPLGRLLVAATERGISAVYLGDADGELEEALRREFPAARLRRDGAELSTWIAAIVRFLDGHQPDLQLPLDVRATAFQWRVWQELMQIPHGEVSTYSDIAQRLGQPGAVRAVARACATNPASLVIPCHRVVRRDGALGGYRWGLERKRSLLQREGAPASHGPSTSVETGALE